MMSVVSISRSKKTCHNTGICQYQYASNPLKSSPGTKHSWDKIFQSSVYGDNKLANIPGEPEG